MRRFIYIPRPRATIIDYDGKCAEYDYNRGLCDSALAVGIGVGLTWCGGGGIAPTAAITSPTAAFLVDVEYDVSLAVSYTCTDGATAELFAIIDGAAAVSWGTDADCSEGSGTITRTLEAVDRGAVVELYVAVTGPGGTTNSASVTGEVTDVRGLITTYDGFEIDVPTSTLTSVGVTDPGVVNGGFDDGSAWTVVANWAIADGVASHTGGVIGECSQDVGQTVGFETTCTWTLASTDGQNCSPVAGATTIHTKTAPGTYTGHANQSTNGLLRIVAGVNLDGSIDDVSCSSLSVSRCTVTKAGASFTGATWTQATALAVPYNTSDRQIGGRTTLYLGSNQDSLASSMDLSAFRFLHYKAGTTYPEFSMVHVLNLASITTGNEAIQTRTNAAGIMISTTTAGAIVVPVAASTGVQFTATSADATFAINTVYVLSVLCDGTNLVVRLNGTQVATAACAGTCTDTNPGLAFRLFGIGSWVYTHVLADNPTLAELQMVERWAA